MIPLSLEISQIAMNALFWWNKCWRAYILAVGSSALPGWSGLRPEPRSWACPRSLSSAWAWRSRRCPPGGGCHIRHICRPRPARSSSSRADGDCPGPSGRAQPRKGTSGQGRAISDEESCKESLWSLSESINFNCPPDDSFVERRNGKDFCTRKCLGSKSIYV